VKAGKGQGNKKHNIITYISSLIAKVTVTQISTARPYVGQSGDGYVGLHCTQQLASYCSD
jgi:hypothetical protein